MSIELRFLPAQAGDAIWIRWTDDDGTRRQILVDMGQGATGKRIRQEVAELHETERHFDLLVITHVDADHIGGAITGIAETVPLDGWTFDDTWFNGWPHMLGFAAPRNPPLEAQGPVQGEVLAKWLGDSPWNEEFHRKAVERTTPLQTSACGDVLITVIGPPHRRLERFKTTWAEKVNEAVDKARLPQSDRRDATNAVPQGGRRRPVAPVIADDRQLDQLADRNRAEDTAPANGCSICLVLEWNNQRVLLTGDAWPTDVCEGLDVYAAERHLQSPLDFALVKLPHHGSQNNVSDELLDRIRCSEWVISTSGSIYYHPDAPAIARLLRSRRRPRPRVHFNVPSEFNQWWSSPPLGQPEDWTKRFNYSTTTGTAADGLTCTVFADGSVTTSGETS
ncbi:MBL fold metallo-hydrolase [Agromyces sp. ZXT2-3]|uniref:MBL fold metallo-hydrolase n=1 Tax=Agromyces sp. ZXT2-3 TaxID=3461152 RepID=UPI004054B206